MTPGGDQPASRARFAEAFARRRAAVLDSPRYRWWVLWTVLAGLLSVNITFTVFVVALPQVARQLHSNAATLTWTSTAPLLAYGVVAPVFGKVGDIWGQRKLYMVGLVGAAITVVATASAPTALILILARALDGVQGAATGSTSMALVLRVFSAEDRVKAMGWWALVGAGGPVLGITVGAPIIQYLGWRALFWCELPLMAMAMALAFFVLPSTFREHDEDRPKRSWSELDWTGSATLSIGVTAGLLGLDRGPSWGWGTPGPIGLFALAVVCIAGFIVRERTATHPLVPLSYFGKRNFTFPLLARSFGNFAYMGGFFLFPLLMENVYGYSETKAGLISTARPLLFSIIAPVAGYGAVVVGERLTTVGGLTILTGSMLLFTRFGEHPSMWLVLAALAMSGAGIGIATPSTAASSANELAGDVLGVMSATQQLVTQIGIVAGIQIMVTVQSSVRDLGPIPTSFHRAYFVGAIAALLAVGFGAFTRNTPRPSRRGFDASAALEGAEAGALDAPAIEGALSEA